MLALMMLCRAAEDESFKDFWDWLSSPWRTPTRWHNAATLS